ncbi:dipicolinate synthase subunit B [Lutispora saccharofermentans]|uniref:Dipicolinate synthase subunit B n=1 Tax=Lutispora saccharofermentans TaxID=3024236 RepID=A0ABT1N9L0_9FIRM|nr:dipicolinate synthase subunit B [Lutispora saccharofermentans]MCQ1527940.1 dipicolinate synthase subunit B [Lutispora saccharofermentans]
MKVEGLNIGFGITGSFCTFSKITDEIQKMIDEKANVIPIFSLNASTMDTRFGKAEDWIGKIEKITGNKSILTVQDAEPIGPNSILDILVIAPCTGNTIAKLANAITDTPLLMAAKAHLRGMKPVVIGISTNDGLGMNAKNLGILLNTKYYYFVPFGQDSPYVKCNSLIARMDMILPTVEMAIEGKQIQPLIVQNIF